MKLRFNWNAGIALDPFDDAVYYGSQFVHKSTDMGYSWNIISPDLTTNDPEKQRQAESGGLTYDVTNAENYTTIITSAPRPVERGVIWVGTDDGNVQITRDGGGTWTNVVDRIRRVPSNTWVPHIEPSKFEGGTAFVVFDDHRRANNTPYVYKTTDYGRSWSNLVTAEIDTGSFVHAIEQDPVNRNLLYLGTEYGMYVSLNGGTNWYLWRHGVPRAPVRALVVHPRDHDLVIGTHGRATYILDDVRPLRALANDMSIIERPLHLFEIPATIQYKVAQVDGMRFLADAKFVGENRPYGALLTYYVQQGSDSATIEVLDESDEVIRTFKGPAMTGINRTAWDLRRNGFHRPPPDVPVPVTFRPRGPDILPGTYTVRVTHGAHEASQTVEVYADPRFDIALADRKEKMSAIMRVGQRQEVATEAIERIREAQSGVDQVLEQLKGENGTAEETLTESANDLAKKLTELEEAFLGPQNVQGIADRSAGVFSSITRVYGSLTSSWEAPTEAERIYVQQAESALEELLERVNRTFRDDVAAFRDQVNAAGLALFPVEAPLTIDWRPEN